MITVLGATGFIGSNIVSLLQSGGETIFVPGRDEALTGKDLGDVIYCIGLTADFRTRPFDTVEAHVSKLSELLRHGNFNSLTYLSSTRVYINCTGAEVDEASIIPINVHDSSELYTLTKLTGERICLSCGRKVRIVRLSNVYGNDMSSGNFLTTVLKDIINTGAVSFNVGLASSKDYISIDDACSLVIKIAKNGTRDLYNVASGFNTSNESIVDELRKYLIFETDTTKAATAVQFPVINNSRIREEFSYQPQHIINHIKNLVNSIAHVSN